MIRSAAKNHGYVAVCTDPTDLAEVLEAVKAGGTTLAPPDPGGPRLCPHGGL
jgi:phosphoribosylaminoimidazolecarboxamide formyltransferase/IMP cyclohydrolase